MDKMELIQLLATADQEEMGFIFEDFIRGAMRFAFAEAMVEEVESLCGQRHGRGRENEYVRAGSAPGVAFFGTDSEEVRRPRVRRRGREGSSEEVVLKTYQAGREGSALRETILDCFVAGVSARQMAGVVESQRRTSKSEVSRIWQSRGKAYIEALRGKALSEESFVVLMFDGVVLSDQLTAIVAMGVSQDGRKHMLDFEIGSSENSEVCTALTSRLVEREIRLAARRPLVVIDGSKAIRRAVREHWPDAAIQTCLVHVARNIRARLSHRWHGELESRFNALRKASSLEPAIEAFDALKKFVAKHSAEGLKVLELAQEEMLTLFTLGVPDSLNPSLLSSNSIENAIRNIRRVHGRITRWRADTEMASKWMACAMVEAQKGLRRIQGYRHLDKLIEALNR